MFCQTDFGFHIVAMLFFSGAGLFLVIAVMAAWLMATNRVYGNNPKDLERSMRIIEAYARVCVVCAFCGLLFSVGFIWFMMTKGLVR